MHIQVRGQAARFLAEANSRLEVEWAGPITVADLLQTLGAGEKLVAAVVNGQRVGPDHVLADGDNILLFSPMAGG
jgi:sulfur carrier protein ThiS